MKLLPVFMSALLLLASSAWGDASPAVATDAPEPAPMPEPAPSAHEPGWQPAPGTTAAWADRCTDFTVNGWAFKDPANFSRWLDAFSDPGIYLELTRRAMEPRDVTHSLGTLLDPAAAWNYGEWADPVIYQKWAAALADPDFYTRNNDTLFDPGKFMRWVMLPLDPRPWHLLGTALNPAEWAKWATAPFDPQVWAPLLKPLPDPEAQLLHTAATATSI
jgi:hypothetical protein